MLWKLISAPVIGALIGYCTNWLAVKMLFRPRRQYHIGKFAVPLTPGVIPKGKKRLAAAVADVLNEQLLTEEALQERLLDPEVLSFLKNSVDSRLQLLQSSEPKTLRELLESVVSAEKEGNRTAQLQKSAEDYLTAKIYAKVCEAHPGKLAADVFQKKMDEMTGESFLIQMMGGPISQMVTPLVTQTVDSYVQENGETLLRKMIGEELDNVLDSDAGALVRAMEENGVHPSEKIVQVYTDAVKKNSGKILSMLNVGEIARRAIEDMDNEQLEKLVLSTMKNELGAIVNLGGVIGLVLGLINMLIYLI